MKITKTQLKQIIKEDGKYIRMNNVIDYMNSIPSDVMLYSLNYEKRNTPQ